MPGDERHGENGPRSPAPTRRADGGRTSGSSPTPRGDAELFSRQGHRRGGRGRGLIRSSTARALLFRYEAVSPRGQTPDAGDGGVARSPATLLSAHRVRASRPSADPQRLAAAQASHSPVMAKCVRSASNQGGVGSGPAGRAPRRGERVVLPHRPHVRCTCGPPRPQWYSAPVFEMEGEKSHCPRE